MSSFYKRNSNSNQISKARNAPYHDIKISGQRIITTTGCIIRGGSFPGDKLTWHWPVRSNAVGCSCRADAIIDFFCRVHHGGATGRALDLWSTGDGFKSYSGQKLRNNLGKVVHTYVPLSPNSITCSLSTGQWAVILCGWEGNCRPGRK